LVLFPAVRQSVYYCGSVLAGIGFLAIKTTQGGEMKVDIVDISLATFAFSLSVFILTLCVCGIKLVFFGKEQSTVIVGKEDVR
jgi:hypothetical protein